MGMSSYKYRRAITISPAETITNAQVQIKFDNTTFDYTKLETDNDLEFFDDAGNSLPFWREKWREGATEESVIWVQVGDLTAGVDKVIYMCYGNPDLDTALDNGDNVFEFFDDFDNLDLTIWNDQPGKGLISQGTSAVKFDVVADTADWWSLVYDAPRLITQGDVIPDNAIIGAKFQNWQTDGSNCHGGIGEYSDDENTILFGRQYTTEDRAALDEVGTPIAGISISAIAEGYLRIEHTTTQSDYYLNDQLVGSTTYPTGWKKLCLFLKTWSAITCSIEFAWVFVAKRFDYTLTIGAEEEYNVTPPAAPSLLTIGGVQGAYGFYFRWTEPSDADYSHCIVEVNINNAGWQRYQNDGTLGTTRDYMRFRKQENTEEPAGYRNEQHISIFGLSEGDTVQARVAAVDIAGNQSAWTESQVLTIEATTERKITLPITVEAESLEMTIELS